MASGASSPARREVNTTIASTEPKISVTDLLIRACAVALRAHPPVNSSCGGDHILRHREINIGWAVALPDGLIVSVIRAADRKSLSEIAAQAHTLTDRARSGKLTPEEFTGGTFTLSNLGMFGIDHFTAVINPPRQRSSPSARPARKPRSATARWSRRPR